MSTARVEMDYGEQRAQWAGFRNGVERRWVQIRGHKAYMDKILRLFVVTKNNREKGIQGQFLSFVPGDDY